MAEVRCPMCSKSNPADVEVCQFCQARLRPLQVSSPAEEPFSHRDGEAVPGKADDLEQSPTDWLDGFRDFSADGDTTHEPEEDSTQMAASSDDSFAGEGFSADASDWLEDMRAPIGHPSTGQGGDIEAGETPDWLHSLRSQDVEGIDANYSQEGVDWNDKTGEFDRFTGAAYDQGQDTETPADSLQDWLTQSDAAEPVGPPSGPEEADVGLPDWLAGEDTGMPDWLTQETTAPEPVESPTPTTTGRETGITGMLDWLEEDEGEVEPDAPLPEPEEARDELPGWLSGEEVDVPDLPDWLSQAEAAPEPEPPQSAPEEAGEGIPDWLAGEGADMPDWLAQETTTPEALEPLTPTPTGRETGITGMLDWLEEDEEGAEPVAPLSESEETDDELPGSLAGERADVPDWLSRAEATPEPEPPPTAPEGAGEGIPDWLAGEGTEVPDWLSRAEATPEPAPPISTPEEAGEGIPYWLAREGEDIPDLLDQAEPAPEETGVVEPSPTPDEIGEDFPDWLAGGEEEMPDWLAGEELEVPFAARPVDEEPAATVGEEEPAMPVEGEPTEAVAEEVPGPLSFLDKEAAAADMLVESYPIEGDEPVEDDLGWLDDLETAFPEFPVERAGMVVSPVGDAVEPFAVDVDDQEEFEIELDGALPDWLSGPAVTEGPEVVPYDGVQAPAEGDVGLMPAELPSWLEAMRPIESVGAPIDAFGEDVSVEGAGPLAGLRGVLPAEPDISRVQKPPVYSVKLRVTDAQQSHVELIKQLLEAEGKAYPIPRPPVITSQRVLRLVIAILLIIATLLALLPGGLQLSMPIYSSETFAANQLIGGLANGTPVLLAVDYEPGLSGEMDAATGAIVDHLMIKGGFLTLISTLPTGPVQAERLVANANQIGGHQYQPRDQYTNLGFIPGGAAGLRSFAETPQQVLPFDLNRGQAWQNVRALTDFGLVIIATDNPDTARSWVEQVQPKLANTPMIMVISAQAEPLVRPYWEAGQIQGLVNGLAQGAAYENLLGRSGNARTYWSAFSIGILIAGVLIVVGGGINAAYVLLARSKESGEGEA